MHIKFLIFCLVFINSWATASTPLVKRMRVEQHVDRAPFGVTFYRPTYLMPAFYTHKPYGKIYTGDTPDNQTVEQKEFKVQLSLNTTLINHLFDTPYSLEAAYTQKAFWQTYAKSQWFRETDYEPELFVQRLLNAHWLLKLGVNHQSNGRGGMQERSWNRAIADATYAGDDWLIGVKVWSLIFKTQSSDLHNPDIADYLGHEEILLSYKFANNQIALTARNIEHPHRGGYELSWSHPISKHFKWYIQAFSGYGQSLIEYNHHTNSIGLGIALSDWQV